MVSLIRKIQFNLTNFDQPHARGFCLGQCGAYATPGYTTIQVIAYSEEWTVTVQVLLVRHLGLCAPFPALTIGWPTDKAF